MHAQGLGVGTASLRAHPCTEGALPKTGSGIRPMSAQGFVLRGAVCACLNKICACLSTVAPSPMSGVLALFWATNLVDKVPVQSTERSRLTYT
jgi:hypothetical protein